MMAISPSSKLNGAKEDKSLFIIKMEITNRGEYQRPLDDWTGGTIIKPFNWKAYNKSQTKEKILFLQLLDELCNMIDEDKFLLTGRKPQSLSHQVFCICVKTYINTSARRVISELELCKRKGYSNIVPHFNSILNYLDNKSVKHALDYLIGLSALPLAQLEDKFAIDATGFSERKYMEKWSDIRQKHYLHRLYRKAHCVYGTYSNIVASTIITEGTAADSPRFKQLLENAAKNFDVKEVTADLAYSSRDNLKFATTLGITPYIPFKKNATGKTRGTRVWGEMYRYFKNNREEFMKHYHQRSNAESGFFMIKQRFGGFVSTKNPLPQTNEILAKILCHNICVLIQEIFLSNIDLDFDYYAKRYFAQPHD